MYENPKYVYYRNKKIPGWWEDYLPKEQNPYKKTDTLTLEIGCLANYWHIHSSNKHPNYRGAEACNFVHDMVCKRFGEAFLTSGWYSGGRKGKKIYHDSNHISYDNAYIGDDQKIHIKNAQKYYEDVIIFVQNVLREISRNHYQSGNDYEARHFFPYATDAEIEQSRIEAEKRKIRTEKYKEELVEYVKSEDFFISEISFEQVHFNAQYGYDDGWFNVGFSFGKISTNCDETKGKLTIVVDKPRLYGANHNRKNRTMATKILDVPYCIYFRGKNTKDVNPVILTVPKDKVSATVKQKIGEVCNQAMEVYNKEHIDIIENRCCTPIDRYYPYNIFLDNQIGKLNLIYRENLFLFERNRLLKLCW